MLEFDSSSKAYTSWRDAFPISAMTKTHLTASLQRSTTLRAAVRSPVSRRTYRAVDRGQIHIDVRMTSCRETLARTRGLIRKAWDARCMA